MADLEQRILLKSAFEGSKSFDEFFDKLEELRSDGEIDLGISQESQRAIENTGSKLSSVVDKIKEFGSSNFGSTLLGVFGAGALTGGITAFSAAIAAASENVKALQLSLAQIATISDDAFVKTDSFKNSIIELSKQFGTSAADQASSFYKILSSGITDTAKAQEILEASNRLAIGGLANVADVTKTLTTAINVYGKSGLTAAQASDQLFEAVKLGTAEISDLASTLGDILPAASALGVGFSDVVAAVAELTTKGVAAGEAVTQVNSVFTGLLKNQDRAKKLGPEVAAAFSTQALATKGLSGFLKDLNTATKGSEETLLELFGRVEGFRATIAFAADDFNGLTKAIEQIKGSGGSAQKAFEEISNTLDFQTKRFQSLKEAATIRFASIGQDEILSSLTSINNAIEFTLNNFGLISTRIISALTGIAVFLKASKFDKQLEDAFKTRSINLNISQFVSNIKTSFLSAGASIKAFGLSAGASIKAFVTSLNLAKIGVTAFKATLSFGITIAIDALIQKIVFLSESVGGFGNVLKLFALETKQTFFDISAVILEALTSIIGYVSDFGKTLSKNLSGIPGIGTLANKFSELSKSSKQFFEDTAKTARSRSKEIQKEIDNLFKSAEKANQEISGVSDQPSLDSGNLQNNSNDNGLVGPLIDPKLLAEREKELERLKRLQEEFLKDRKAFQEKLKQLAIENAQTTGFGQSDEQRVADINEKFRKDLESAKKFGLSSEPIKQKIELEIEESRVLEFKQKVANIVEALEENEAAINVQYKDDPVSRDTLINNVRASAKVAVQQANSDLSKLEPRIDSTKLALDLEKTENTVNNKLKEIEVQSGPVGQAIEQNLAGGIADAIKGTETLGETFSKITDSIISDLTRLFLQKSLTGAFANSFGVGAATGGLITGPGSSTSDSIPARLSNGEFVLNARSVKAIGLDNLNALNKMNFDKFNLNKINADSISGAFKNLSAKASSISGISRFESGGLVNSENAPKQNIGISIENSGTEKQVVGADTTFQGDQLVVNVILSDLKKNGPVSQNMAGAFGLRRRGT